MWLCYFICRLLLDITNLCNRSAMINLILIKENTEKLCSHYILINTLKLIKVK